MVQGKGIRNRRLRISIATGEIVNTAIQTKRCSWRLAAPQYQAEKRNEYAQHDQSVVEKVSANDLPFVNATPKSVESWIAYVVVVLEATHIPRVRMHSAALSRSGLRAHRQSSHKAETPARTGCNTSMACGGSFHSFQSVFHSNRPRMRRPHRESERCICRLHPRPERSARGGDTRRIRCTKDAPERPTGHQLRMVSHFESFSDGCAQRGSSPR